MKQALLSFCIIILFAAASGCSNSSNVNTPASVNGTITGVVILGSELNNSSPGTLASSAGVSVSLDGTTLSTLSDSSGFWKLDNVPDGNYDVTITKSGFGLMRIYGVAINGPGTTYIPRVNLGEQPTQTPELVSATVANVVWSDTGKQKQRQELQVSWTTPYDRNYCGLIIFLDRDSTVQPGDTHFYSSANSATSGTLMQEWLGWSGGDFGDPVVHATAHEGVLACPVETLRAHGMTSGMKIYVSLAQYDPYSVNGQTPNNNVVYYDPVHNQNRLISPSPRSNVVSITIP